VKLRLDKFTIAVLAIVAVLLVVAVVTVNRSASQANESYRTEDQPDTPVINAFLAFQKGDLATARRQYSQKVLDEIEKQGGGTPLRGDNYYGDASRRLRVLKTEVDPKDSDRAYVTAAIDTYNAGGPFNSGSTWSSDRVIEVVREDGVWKLNTQEYFY
jgi:hypothetical protein